MNPMRQKISNLLIVAISWFQNYLTLMYKNDNLAKKFIRTFWAPDAFNGRLQHGLSISAPLYKRDWGQNLGKRWILVWNGFFCPGNYSLCNDSNSFTIDANASSSTAGSSPSSSNVKLALFPFVLKDEWSVLVYSGIWDRGVSSTLLQTISWNCIFGFVWNCLEIFDLDGHILATIVPLN